MIETANQAFSGPLARAGYDLSLLFAESQVSGTTSAVQSNNPLLQVAGGRVVVDVLPASSSGATRADLESLGFQIIGESPYVVSGWLPVAELADTAALPSVWSIHASYRAVVSAGAVDSQGPKAQQSDKVLSYLGLTGAGVTVGVISDSFGNSTADVASGDLPKLGSPYPGSLPVNVIDDSLGGTDEGRAMLQIVHDTAPGANLAFATGGLSQTQFRNNIVNLANSGANVIVDDFLFLSEPMFVDGIVAKAVDAAVAKGVTYFSAAGNNGRASYQSEFRNSGQSLTGTGPFQVPADKSAAFIAHDFDPGTGESYFQTLTLPAGVTNFSFQWTDSFRSLGGAGSQTNLNLAFFDMSGKFLSTSGGFNQNVGDDPVEVFSFNNTTGGPLTVKIAIGKESGPDPVQLKYVAFQPAGQTAFSIDDWATNSGTIFGHANAAGALAIGAALYSETPPYGASPPVLQPYSSRGSTPIYFDATGLPLATPQIRQSPDFVAPDGVNTTFFGQADPVGSGPFEGDGLPNFFGTSAAAPHAAGVAALMLQARPGLSPGQVSAALQATAIDMNAPGYDTDSGWGLINATASVVSLNGGPYLVNFEGTSGSDTMLIRRDLSGNNLEFLLGGTVQLSIPAAQVASIRVNGREGADSLTLDSRNGAISRAVAFDGGSGADSFALLGTADLPGDINAYSDAAPIPTITLASGIAPLLTLKDVEGAVIESVTGVVNLIGDNNSFLGQADAFVVRGTGSKAFTASLNGSSPVQFLSVGVLNVAGRSLADQLSLTPWASNSTAGWGLQVSFDGGGPLEGNLLVYNTVAANPVSEAIAIQPASPGAGEIRVLNAGDSSAIAIISYANTDLAVNDTDGFASDTDTLTLRGTNAVETFAIDLAAAGTAGAPWIDVRLTGGSSLYKLRTFSGFPTVGILGYGSSDLVEFRSGRMDGAVAFDIDLGLPAGGPLPTDRDQIQFYGTDAANDSFHYTPGGDVGSGAVAVARAGATAPTRVDFRSVEVVGFSGGAGLLGGLGGADTVIIDGTSGNDTITLAAVASTGATAQVNGGPLIQITGLGNSGSTIRVNGLDGADVLELTQALLWTIAGVYFDGGGGNDTVSIVGTSTDDTFIFDALAATIGLDASTLGNPIPFNYLNTELLRIDGLGHNLGDRLRIVQPIGFTPTANSGTVPSDPPLEYRNIEFFTVNQLPSPSNDFAITNEDTAVLIDVLANDSGLGNGPVSLLIAAPPAHGTVALVGNKIRYTPAADYNGTDQFTYRVEDADGDFATAIVSVTIAPVNDPPVAISGSVSTLEDAETTFFLTGDDGDPEVNQTLTFTLVGTPQYGTITAFNPFTGQVSYRPANNFAGTDTIQFRVTDDNTAGGSALTSGTGTISIVVQGVNDAPIANPLSIGVNEDTPIGFTLTGDDGDPEANQKLTFTIASGPLHGAITGFDKTTGKGTYTPFFNYNGPDFFTFFVTDDATAGGPALNSATVAVSISVAAVNDPPTAFSQTVSVAEDGSTTITLQGTDGDPETDQVLTFALIATPLHGTLSNFNPLTGTVLYTPNPGYAGSDVFTFIVTDDGTAGGPPRTSTTVGTIAINVQGSNDAPKALPQSVATDEDTPLTVTLTGDDGDPEVNQVLTFAIVSGPQHGTISKFDPANGTFLYTPDENYNGPDSIQFTVTDDTTAGGPALTSGPAVISFTVNAVNDRPVAFSQNATVLGNKSVVITLTADDGDPDVFQHLTFAITGGPASGTLTPLDGTSTAAGSLRWLYRPNLAFVGTDSFTFTVTDNGSPALTSVPATVTIDVTRPPDGIYVTGAGEGGGPHVKVYNSRTNALLASFFAYSPSFTGGVRVAVGDVNGDGVPDVITGAGVGGFPHVKVFDGKTFAEIASFYAFDMAFGGGINVAAGDLDGLPGDEIVVGAGSGGGPHVRSFKFVNGSFVQLDGPLGSFYAYAPDFTGGVNVAVGNFDGVPGDEIITGAGMLGGPHVKVFSTRGVIASFFAFPDNGRLGVTVAAGDVDGDGKAEILTGSGVGGGPVPRLFNGGTAELRTGFAAFAPDYRGGITVGTTDADGDGKADLIIAPTQSAREVRIFDGETLDVLDEFDAYSSNFLGGVYVAGK
ncbi:MAG: Ig-like domain-containing protein [Gemmataceae bacterium]